jgi:hypothetical protein
MIQHGLLDPPDYSKMNSFSDLFEPTDIKYET